MSVNLINTYDIIPLNVSAGCENLETTKASVERHDALNSAKKICCYSIDGGCTRWQNVIIQYLTDIAAMFRMMQFLSYQICKQHNCMW